MRKNNKTCKSVSLLLLLIFASCKKSDNISNNEPFDKYILEDTCKQDTVDIVPLPLGIYRGTEDVFSPNRKMLRVYNNEVMDTPWGSIYSPIIYLYSKENKELAKYNTDDLVSDNFWPGIIDITYNADRNSFDLIFSLDAYGNYGAGYIDLNTNVYFREVDSLSRDDEKEKKREQQGIPDWEEGSILKAKDPIIFKKDP